MCWNIVMVNKPAVFLPKLQLFLSHHFSGTIPESLFSLIYLNKLFLLTSSRSNNCLYSMMKHIMTEWGTTTKSIVYY